MTKLNPNVELAVVRRKNDFGGYDWYGVWCPFYGSIIITPQLCNRMMRSASPILDEDKLPKRYTEEEMLNYIKDQEKSDVWLYQLEKTH